MPRTSVKRKQSAQCFSDARISPGELMQKMAEVACKWLLVRRATACDDGRMPQTCQTTGPPGRDRRGPYRECALLALAIWRCLSPISPSSAMGLLRPAGLSQGHYSCE